MSIEVNQIYYEIKYLNQTLLDTNKILADMEKLLSILIDNVAFVGERLKK